MRVLILTIPPFEGGVPMLARIVCGHLQSLGHHVTLAYYAALSQEPELCAPLWRAVKGARPGTREGQVFGGVQSIAVGTWLPEFEVPYYLPSRRWNTLIDSHDRHLAIGGNVLTSYPLLKAGVPHMMWCATPFLADRKDRQARMSPLRLLWDKALTCPILQAMERAILKGPATLYSISRYAQEGLTKMSGREGRCGLLTVPTDTSQFSPPKKAAKAGTVGFAGRINDPRKNMPLLLGAIAQTDLTLRLTGEPDAALKDLVRTKGLADRVTFLGNLERDQLPDFYRSLDVFALPSHQEGLGIVGVEALACGVPVVSTRCGGPEDFVDHGENGFLVGHDAGEMAERLTKIVRDRSLRDRFSKAARRVALERYSQDRFAETFAEAWGKTWGEEP